MMLRTRVLIGALLISHTYLVREVHGDTKGTSPGVLSEWILQNGGQVSLEIGAVNAEGLRGALAARDFKQGEIVAAVPYTCTIDLGAKGEGDTAAELTTNLFKVRFEEPERWAHMQPYWASMPDRSQLYNKYIFQSEHLPLLQDPNMESLVTRVVEWLGEVYTGAKTVEPQYRFTSLVHHPGAADISREDFAHYAALLDSYSFSFPAEDGQAARRVVLPLLDLINHGGNPNVALKRDPGNSSYVVTALRPIKQGEEVVHLYSWSLERNDKSLLNYFFVQEQEPPVLCSLDLPGVTVWDTVESPPADHELYGPGAPLCIQEEVDRLRSILVKFPTGEDQDAAVLESGELTDWREKVIVKFRMLRKRAIRLTMQGVQAALEEAAEKQAGPAVIVPIPGASEELQEAAFIDADTVAQLEAAAVQRKAQRVSAGAAAPGGGSEGRPAVGKGEKVKKLKPVRPVKGASEELQEPKIAQVASPAVGEL